MKRIATVLACSAMIFGSVACKNKPKPPPAARSKAPANTKATVGAMQVTSVRADGEKGKRVSPLYTTTIQQGKNSIAITYSRPFKRGRKIFGGLVPFQQMWRTGANEATTLTTTQAITLGGKAVPAGSYALLTIPGQASWTVVLSKQKGMWGSGGYDKKQDLLRLEVKPNAQAKATENFTITAVMENKAPALALIWDKTKVLIPFAFATGAGPAKGANSEKVVVSEKVVPADAGAPQPRTSAKAPVKRAAKK